ncbi:uncharacterized protein C20orf96 homolog isoform X3 [Mycteria americana]|uniref:uncharacterized protein C20orf96 homolog isoform X3 n=1 Tax=Mycteria americana TaxID=33587 RepID=UPI003F58DF5D
MTLAPCPGSAVPPDPQGSPGRPAVAPCCHRGLCSLPAVAAPQAAESPSHGARLAGLSGPVRPGSHRARAPRPLGGSRPGGSCPSAPGLLPCGAGAEPAGGAPPAPSRERGPRPASVPACCRHGDRPGAGRRGRGDYGKRQKAEAEGRKSPARRPTLPPLTNEDKKKKGEKNKPVAFMLSKKTPLPSETSSSQEKYSSFTQRKLALKKAELTKTLEEIKITTNLTNLKKNAIEELKQRSARLAEANCWLIKDIQHTDDSTAKQARVLLQQYEVFQEEINKAEEMGKAVLEELEEKARAEQEALLQKVVEEMLLHQDGLKQMVINNHVLRREILRQREIIKDLEEEIGELKGSIQTLRQSARDPRELIFADVLLRRPNGSRRCRCRPGPQLLRTSRAHGGYFA